MIIVVAINDIMGSRRVCDKSSFFFCFFFRIEFDEVDGFLVDIGRGWFTGVVRLLNTGLG